MGTRPLPPVSRPDSEPPSTPVVPGLVHEGLSFFTVSHPPCPHHPSGGLCVTHSQMNRLTTDYLVVGEVVEDTDGLLFFFSRCNLQWLSRTDGGPRSEARTVRPRRHGYREGLVRPNAISGRVTGFYDGSTTVRLWWGTIIGLLYCTYVGVRQGPRF